MSNVQTIACPANHLPFADWCERNEHKSEDIGVHMVNGRVESVESWFETEKHPLFITTKPICEEHEDNDYIIVHGVYSAGDDCFYDRAILVIDAAGIHVYADVTDHGIGLTGDGWEDGHSYYVDTDDQRKAIQNYIETAETA